MKIKIPKDFHYHLLFAMCVGVTYINIYELTFAVWLFTMMVTLKKNYSLTLLQYISSFTAILLIAFVVSFFYDSSKYEAIRDITYLIKPIIGMIIGYQLCRNQNIKPFQTIIYTGVLIALIHLWIIAENAVIHKIINIHVLREFSGYFSDFEVYSLICVMFHKQLGVTFTRKRFWTLILILSISSALYISRTNFIQFILFVMAMKGYFRLTRKSLTIVGSLIVFTLISYAIIYSYNPARNGKGMEAVFYKIKNAPIETFKTKVDKDNYEDFNDNYRSFENITTVRQVSMEGTPGILFGKGLGATIDVGRRMYTNDGTYVRHEPIVHNAYMTVFLKSGIVGVIFMIVFLFQLGRQKKYDHWEIKQVNLMLFSTAIFLIVANWVLLGLFLKLDNKSIIIGFLLCYKELLVKQQNVIQKDIS